MMGSVSFLHAPPIRRHEVSSHVSYRASKKRCLCYFDSGSHNAHSMRHILHTDKIQMTTCMVCNKVPRFLSSSNVVS